MKVAVVTGASYGLGTSICDALLFNKFKIFGISRTKPPIVHENFNWVKTDLYHTEDIKNLFNKINEEKIDLLVNNAGTHIEEPALNFSLKNFHKVFDLNFIAPILITKILSTKLDNGLVINISSTSDRFAEKSSGLYCASKSALNIFLIHLRLKIKT